MQTLPIYGQLIEDTIQKFIRLFTETEPQFLNESSVHKLRKKNTRNFTTNASTAKLNSIKIRKILQRSNPRSPLDY